MCVSCSCKAIEELDRKRVPKMEFWRERGERCKSVSETENCVNRLLARERNSNSISRMTNNSSLSVSDGNRNPVMIEVLFTYVATVSLLIAMTEILTILILKHAKVLFQIRYFSISFLLADILFQLVSFVHAMLMLNFNDSDHRIVIKLFRQFGKGITSCISISSVAILSWDRVISLAWPLKYRVFVNPTRVRYAIIANWLLNTLFYSIAVGMFYRTCSSVSNNWCRLIRKDANS